MDHQNRVFLIAGVVITLVVVLIIFQPTIEKQLAPEPKIAWVAIQVEGSDEAVVGPLEIASGTRFTLHAVLEAEGRGGRSIFYTEAKHLRFPDREIEPDAVRPWDRPLPVRQRWFTVEGRRPFLELGPGETLDELAFTELLRPEWPLAWSVPGDLTPANIKHLDDAPITRHLDFGTQRYHVRIEIYDHEDQLIPTRTVRSWGAAEAVALAGSFPSVVASLPGRLGPASEVFGRIHVATKPGADKSLLAQIDQLARRGLVFSRATVLRDQLEAAGLHYDQLRWRLLDLSGGEIWSGAREGSDVEEGVDGGDLLRAGERLVVLYQDRGVLGIVDYPDLCFDFAQGAKVRELGDVFTGEGQVVERASLAPAPAQP